MESRQALPIKTLHYRDIFGKVSFILTTENPLEKTTSLSAIANVAFIYYKSYFSETVYFFNQNSLDKSQKCIQLSIDNKKLNELKTKFNFTHEIKLQSLFHVMIESMSTEQIDLMFGTLNDIPPLMWLGKIIFDDRKLGKLRKKRWEVEHSIREGLPEKSYKSTHPSHFTDYTIEKINNGVLKKQYDVLVASIQSLDDAFTEYGNNVLTKEGMRAKVRSEINALSLENKLAAICALPGPAALCTIIDILADLKRKYEKAIIAAYNAATGKKLTNLTFEDFYFEIFKSSAKERYKLFAQNPIEKMAAVEEEFNTIIKELWNKHDISQIDENKKNVFNLLFETGIYLSSTYETLRLTDRVARWNTASTFEKMSLTMDATEFQFNTNATQVLNSFAITPYSAANITPIEKLPVCSKEDTHAEIYTIETYPLWMEAVIWLHGFYQHSLAQISPYFKINNEVDKAVLNHFNDNEDRDLHKAKPPLVKWSLAQYHGPHAWSLVLQLPEKISQPLLAYLPVEVQQRYLAIQSKSQLPINAQPITCSQIQLTNTNSSLFFSTDKPFLPAEKVEELVLENDEVERFSKFAQVLKKYALNEDQIQIIKNQQTIIVRKLENYINARVTDSFVPLPIFRERVHGKAAKETLAIIKSSGENISQYIDAIYQLWAIAKADHSEYKYTFFGIELNPEIVYPATTEVLTHALNVLKSPIPKEAKSYTHSK